MASGPITSWEIDGETVETLSNFILGGSKITADGDRSHEIKRRLLLGMKVMTNLENILRSRDVTLPTRLSQVYGFSSGHVWMWKLDCEETECQRIDSFGLWCSRRLLRVPWTARRSNQSILKCWSWNSNTLATWFEELTHWKRPWCWEGLGAGEEGDVRDEMAGWHHWLDGHEFGWTPGVDDGQGGLGCCNSWGHKEWDMTERVKWTELNMIRCLSLAWLTSSGLRYFF